MQHPQDDKGNAALHLASNKGTLPIVEALLEAGADPQLLNQQGDTSLKLIEDSLEQLQITLSSLQQVREDTTPIESKAQNLQAIQVLL